FLSFFFSSRRRHTRWPRDWSSDVCSSDLQRLRGFPGDMSDKVTALGAVVDETVDNVRRISSELRPAILDDLGLVAALEWHAEERSEERRVGKERRSRWRPNR